MKSLLVLMSILLVNALAIADNETYYYVKRGDSLMTISFQYYGTHQKWRIIENANPEVNPKKLTPGQKLLIPDPQNEVYSQKPVKNDPNLKKDAKKTKIEDEIAKKKELPETLPKKEEEKFYQVNEENYNKIEKYEELEKAYTRLKEENNKIEEKLLAMKELRAENKRLKDKLVNAKTELADEFSKELQAYTDLTEAQAKILQEKHRILSQRLWVQKNKRVDRCELQVNSNEQQAEQTFLDFISFLNTEIGEENVFVKPEQNQVVLHLPGKTVYGVYGPTIRSEYQNILANMTEYIEKLNIDHLNITGHSRFETVYNKDKDSRSGYAFIMDQSLAIQDFFTNQMGLSPKKFSVSSFGASRPLKENSKSKRFKLTLSLKDKPIEKRTIASIDQDVGYEEILNETMSYIGEPKYSNVKITDDAFEIHMARDYFWRHNNAALTATGKQKIARIMQMMSKVEDVTYQFYWVPGVEETNEARNRSVAFRQLESLRDYLNKGLDLPPANVEMGYKNRLHMLRYPSSKDDDKYNSRLIIRIQPTSVSTRSFD